MDKLDSRIIQALQYDFPTKEKPYHVLAERLQISIEMLWERISRLKAQGLIRRIGASFDSRKLGFSGTLAAVSVEPERIEQTAKIIGEFPQVTHSYLRNDSFNIWFTIIAANNKKIDEILNKIRVSLSLKDSQILNLPMKRRFKLDTRFRPMS